MEKYQLGQNKEASLAEVGLMTGGLAVLGTLVGAGVGFLAGGGVDGFVNGGWISMVNGTIIASSLCSGLGLLNLSNKVKHISTSVSLRFVALTILGTNLGGVIGFLLGGGSSGFLNHGWAYKLTGLILGSLLSAGLGLVAWSSTLRKHKLAKHNNIQGI